MTEVNLDETTKGYQERKFYDLLMNCFGGVDKIPQDFRKKHKSLFSRLKNDKSKISKRNKVLLIESLLKDKDISKFIKNRISLGQDQFSASFYINPPSGISGHKFDQMISHQIYGSMLINFHDDSEATIEEATKDLKISSNLKKLLILRLVYLGIIAHEKGKFFKRFAQTESLDISLSSQVQKLRILKTLEKLRSISIKNKILKSRLILINKNDIPQMKLSAQKFYDKVFDRFYKSSGSKFEMSISFYRCSN